MASNHIMHTTSVLVAVQDRDLLVSLLIFLREAADLSVVGTASDTDSIVALLQTTHADALLTDESLMVAGNPSIIDVMAHIVPRPSLVVLAAEADGSSRHRVADAIVLTHTSPELLIKTLRQVTESSRHIG